MPPFNKAAPPEVCDHQEDEEKKSQLLASPMLSLIVDECLISSKPSLLHIISHPIHLCSFHKANKQTTKTPQNTHRLCWSEQIIAIFSTIFVSSKTNMTLFWCLLWEWCCYKDFHTFPFWLQNNFPGIGTIQTQHNWYSYLTGINCHI